MSFSINASANSSKKYYEEWYPRQASIVFLKDKHALLEKYTLACELAFNEIVAEYDNAKKAGYGSWSESEFDIEDFYRDVGEIRSKNWDLTEELKKAQNTGQGGDRTGTIVDDIENVFILISGIPEDYDACLKNNNSQAQKKAQRKTILIRQQLNKLKSRLSRKQYMNY